MINTAVQIKPYKGLVPYSEEDAPFFFGREEKRDTIINNLLASRLTLLVGASGVGKSSLLRAGVAHRLRKMSRENLRRGSRPEFYAVVFSAWDGDPVAGLLGSVRDAVAQTLDEPNLSAPTPAGGSLADALRAWAEHVEGDLLIILDQFEEYFQYHGHEAGPGTFAYEWPRALSDAGLRANFLVSIREDSFARLDRFRGRVPNLFGNYLRVEHLTRAAAHEAIVKPLECYNELVGAPALRVGIEPELIEEVLRQTRASGDRPTARESGGEGHIEVSYLQQVMQRLWDEETQAGSRVLRLETLRHLGGAEAILRTHLDRTISGLTRGQQHAAASVFRYLVTPSGTKIAQTASDLAAYAGLAEGEVRDLLEVLAGVRVLRLLPPPPDRPEAAPRYEIFHDMLAPAILDWLGRHEREQFEERIRREAAERAEAERAEAARQRELDRARYARRLASVLALLLIVSSVLSLFLYIQYGEANKQRLEALKQKDKAEIERAEAERQRAEAEKQRKTADEQTKIAQAALSEAEKQREKAEQEADRERRAEADANRQKNLAVAQRVAALRAKAREIEERLRAEAAEKKSQLNAAIAEGEKLHAEEERRAAVKAQDDAIRGRVEAEQQRNRAEKALKDLRQKTVEAEWQRAKREQALDLLKVSDESPAYFAGIIRGPNSAVTAASLRPDLHAVVTASEDDGAQVWDTGQLSEQYSKREDPKLFVPTPTPAESTTPANGPTPAENTMRADGATPQTDGPAATPASVESVAAPVESAAAPTPSATPTPVPAVTAFGSGSASHLVVVASDDVAQVLSRETDKPLRRLRAPGKIDKVALSPDGLRVVTVGADGARLWDWSDCPSAEEPCGSSLLGGHGGAVNSVQFAPNSSDRVATASADGTARVWDLSTCRHGGECRFVELRGHQAVKLKDGNVVRSVNSVAFNRDGSHVVTAGADGTARVWDAKTGKKLRTLREHNGVLVKSAWGTIRIFSVNRTHRDLAPMNSAAFSPVDPRDADPRHKKAEFVVTGGDDGIVRVWDVRDATPVRVLRGHLAAVRHVEFSPSGWYVVSSSNDLTVRLWQPCKPEDPGKLILFRDVITKDARTHFGSYCSSDKVKQEAPQPADAGRQAAAAPQPSTPPANPAPHQR